MKTVWLLAVKEWKAFFYTPFAMIVLSLYLVLCGSYFSSNLSIYMNLAHPNETLSGTVILGKGITTMALLIRPFFESMLGVLVFVLPLITMRVFAEEKKSATYELLISYPVSPGAILAGKYLGVLTIVMGMLVAGLIYPSVVQYFGQPYWPQIWSTFLGYSLFLMVYTAIGVWASLLTENQLVAAVITYGAFFLSYLLGYLARLVGAPYDQFLANFLLAEHLSSFRAGLIFLGDIVVYMTGTVVFLSLAYLRIKRHFT